MNIEVKNSRKAVQYEKSMSILEQRVKDVISGKKNELLWILEHKNVYTAGSSSVSKDLIDKKVNVLKTNRGGKHTFHGPGQKVIYFVLDLNKRGKNIRKLVNDVENCIISVLEEYDINSHADRKNIGIWINTKEGVNRVAAIGIKVKRWIAYHGFSINISNDLSRYDAIIPCGIKDQKVTNLRKISLKNFNNINKIITTKFLSIFHQ